MRVISYINMSVEAPITQKPFERGSPAPIEDVLLIPLNQKEIEEIFTNRRNDGLPPILTDYGSKLMKLGLLYEHEQMPGISDTKKAEVREQKRATLQELGIPATETGEEAGVTLFKRFYKHCQEKQYV